MNDEQVRILKETTVVYFNVPSQSQLEETEKENIKYLSQDSLQPGKNNRNLVAMWVLQIETSPVI